MSDIDHRDTSKTFQRLHSLYVTALCLVGLLFCHCGDDAGVAPFLTKTDSCIEFLDCPSGSTCELEIGRCVPFAQASDGLRCTDRNRCTRNDTIQDGECVGDTITCSDPLTDVCIPETGLCIRCDVDDAPEQCDAVQLPGTSCNPADHQCTTGACIEGLGADLLASSEIEYFCAPAAPQDCYYRDFLSGDIHLQPSGSTICDFIDEEASSASRYACSGGQWSFEAECNKCSCAGGSGSVVIDQCLNDHTPSCLNSLGLDCECQPRSTQQDPDLE